MRRVPHERVFPIALRHSGKHRILDEGASRKNRRVVSQQRKNPGGNAETKDVHGQVVGMGILFDERHAEAIEFEDILRQASSPQPGRVFIRLRNRSRRGGSP